MTKAKPRAIGIIRVSRVKGREGDSFASPEIQKGKIEDLCVKEGWTLLDVLPELDVSGDSPLNERPGLSQAVAAVLTGEAEIIVGAFSERLWWNHEVRAQVLRLVADAGGEVWAADAGRLTNPTAAEEFTAESRTSADRFTRRQNAEKSRDAVVEAVARGVPPWPNVPPGYKRSVVGQKRNGTPIHGPLEPDPATRDVVVEAFKMRANEATIAEVREHLAKHGIKRSYRGAQSLLSSRVVLGEIHLGDLENLKAHEPIVDLNLWKDAQKVKTRRGPRPKSDRLLARLGVLTCWSCGSRMVVGMQTQNGRQYPFYRCGRVREDCGNRVTIGAEIAEEVVIKAVRDRIADVEGRASAESNAREVEQALEKAQADLDAALRAFAGLEDEAAARERLAELRQVRDAAQEQLDQLGGSRAGVVLGGSQDWDRLSLDGQRALIRATVDRVVINPGRGADRISVEFVGE